MASISEDTMRDTYSYNLDDLIQDSIESSSLISNYYKINSKYINKKGNIYNRSNSTLAIHKKINNRYRDNLNNSRSTNQSEESKTKFFMKENKENQVTLFNNSFIREKQRTFRIKSVNLKNYNLNFNYNNKNNKIMYGYKFVNNDKKLFKSLFSQTRSNFNNKYKIIYSVSDLNQKGKIKNIIDTIKKYQNKSYFTKYLEKKLNRRCLSSKSIIKKDDNFNLNNLSISSRWNKLLLPKKANNFWENFKHNNNLIKVKTLDLLSNKIQNLKKKDNNIFYNNNTFFKTMPKKPIIKKRDDHIL
jgi:hypothetical protein